MTEEEIFKEIQDIVANNPVVVIGSGASVKYDIPGMWKLAQQLKAFFNTHPYTHPDAVKAVDDFLKNIDSGMGLEEALLENKVPEEVENDIVNEVWKTIAQADKKAYQRFVEGEEINLAPLFEYMIYDVKDKVINVVSTNYDKIAEYAACQTTAYINTGFTIGYKGQLKDDIISRPRRTEEDYIGHINILKVHGSLDWFKKDGVVACFPNIADIPKGYTPCIVTPGTNKYERTQQEPHRQLLSAVDKIFNTPSGYLCIGYGFNDQHVHPMLLKNAKKHNNKILIVTKELTPSIQKNVIEQGVNYIAVSAYGENDKGTIFQTPHGELVVEDKIYWTIDGLEKIYK